MILCRPAFIFESFYDLLSFAFCSDSQFLSEGFGQCIFVEHNADGFGTHVAFRHVEITTILVVVGAP